MGSVTLEISRFRDMRPEFTEDAISDTMVQTLWDSAVAIVGNTDETSFFPYDPDSTTPGAQIRQTVLYLVMCHLAAINVLRGLDQAGELTNASEGSVSATFQVPQIANQSAFTAFWSQTACGLQYMLMLRQYQLGGRFYGTFQYHPFG